MSDGVETPASDDVATARVDPSRAPIEGSAVSIGSMLGRYFILEQAGSGGMGEVLRAYDPKLQREVALKLVRGDRLDEQARARVVREARAMAKLSHPNVVAVFDVEEEVATARDVGVMLVMEYVAGETLREWTKRDRSWDEVVTRFIEAGRGLAAAHAENLLHRDFKPANVLVSEADAVKVTDFGLAKLEGEGVSGEQQWETGSVSANSHSDALTQPGVVLGTPRYMAPEQHLGEPLGPAADQYAFCVALWEAITGKPPFSGRQIAAQKRAGPPAWPSSRVPTPVVEALRRGLAANPDERWPTMDALLEALAHDSGRMRRGWAFTLSAIAVVGVAGFAAQTWITARAQRCTGAEAQLFGVWDEKRRAAVEEAILGTGVAYAEGVWTRIEPELTRYAQDWAAMHTEACEATTVRGEQSADVMDIRMACLHRAKMDLAAVTDVLMAVDADSGARVVERAYNTVGGLPPLSRCADVDALQADVEPPAPEDAPTVDRVRQHLATSKAQREAGQFPEAEAALERAEAEAEHMDYDPVRTEIAVTRGFLLDELGEYDGAEEALREALERGTEHRQWKKVRLAASKLMFVIGTRQARPEEGLRFRELAAGLAHDDPRALAFIHGNVGSALRVQGKYGEAEAEDRQAVALLEQALGPDHHHVAIALNDLGNSLYQRGQYVQAESQFRRALGLWEKAFGPIHPQVGAGRNNVAVVLQAQGKYAEAEEEHRRALAIRVEALGPEHPDVAASRNNLALVLQAQRNFEEAEAEYRQCLAILEKTLEQDHPRVAAGLNNLSGVLHGQRKFEEAEEAQRRALAIREKALGPEHPEVATSLDNLGELLQAQRKFADAEIVHRRALAIGEKALGADHPSVAMTRTGLARTLLEQDRAEDALPLAERAWERRKRDDTPAHTQALTAFLLARVLWETGDRSSRPRDLATRGRDEFMAAGESYTAARDKVQRWLDAHP